MGREGACSENTICERASAGKFTALLAWDLCHSRATHSHFSDVNLGTSNVNTALQLPDHNWLVYGQLEKWAFAKEDIPKREYNYVCNGSLPYRWSPC